METRKIGYYKVCHPYHMSKEVVGYWNGKRWKFKDTGKRLFEDDDLNWIEENTL